MMKACVAENLFINREKGALAIIRKPLNQPITHIQLLRSNASQVKSLACDKVAFFFEEKVDTVRYIVEGSKTLQGLLFEQFVNALFRH